MTQPSRRPRTLTAATETLIEAAEQAGYERGRRDATAAMLAVLIDQAGANTTEILNLVGQLSTVTPAADDDPASEPPAKPIVIDQPANGDTPGTAWQPVDIPSDRESLNAAS